MYTDLDPRQSMQPHLPRVLNREVYYKGQTIVEQGAQAFHAYYIEKGSVEIVVREGPHMVRVCTLGTGEIFGEMALIEHRGRSATVRATEDTTVTILSADELEHRVNAVDDKVIKILMHVFIERLCHANEGQLEQYRHLAEFQDRITGLVDKAAHGIDEGKRRDFRDEAEPLLKHLEELLEKYRR